MAAYDDGMVQVDHVPIKDADSGYNQADGWPGGWPGKSPRTATRKFNRDRTEIVGVADRRRWSARLGRCNRWNHEGRCVVTAVDLAVARATSNLAGLVEFRPLQY